MRLSRLIVSCKHRARGVVVSGLMMVSASAAMAAPNPWTGTAYIRQEVRHTLEGKTKGGLRVAWETGVAQCNAFSGLPAVSPPDDLLNGLDVEIVEQYFDNGRALTRRQRYTLELTDYKRWQDERRANPTGQARAPDCSKARKVDITSTVLWMDGVRYEWGPDKKVKGRRSDPSLTPRSVAPDPDASSPDRIHGQPCLRVRVSSQFGNGESCRWTLYPAQSYLNWPWMLEYRAVFGQGPHPLVETARTLDLSIGHASPEGLFALPPDATVKMLP